MQDIYYTEIDVRQERNLPYFRMNIEAFYFSKTRKNLWYAVGLIACLTGLVHLGFFFGILINPSFKFFTVPPIGALSFIILGATIILIAKKHKKAALYLSLWMIVTTIFYMAFFDLIQSIPLYKTLSVAFIPQGSLVVRDFIAGLIFFLLSIALLCNSFSSLKQVHLWIAVICAGAAFGFAVYFVVFNSIKIEFVPFVKVHLSNTTAFLTALIAVAVLFYSGSAFAYRYPNHFALWLPTFATIAALLLTLTSWLSFVARERELIAKESENKLMLIKERLLQQGAIYFSTLNRMQNRWHYLGVKNLHNPILDIDADTFSVFPSLKEFGVMDDQGKMIDLNPLSTTKSLFSLFSLILQDDTKENPTKDLKVFFVKDPANPKHWLIAYVGFPHPNVTKKAYFFASVDAQEFFSEALQPFLHNVNSISIHSGPAALFNSHAEDTQFKTRYLSEETFDFFGAPLSLEIWPTSAYGSTMISPASSFQLVIGVIFSFTLFWALYLAQIAFRKKQEADKANKEKTMFLANMSHEIRTPLHGIIGSCSLLELSKLDDYQKKWVEGINRSGKMLMSLLDDLLDMSKIEANAITLELIDIHLKPLLEEVITVLTPNAKAKKIDLQFTYAPTLPDHFFLDGKRVRQIVANLMDNAIKFTQEGFVRLAVAQSEGEEGNYLILRIEDSGIGISEERLKNIFNTYLSIDIRTEKGSGLGLAITKRLVELMGGWIEVESKLGKGSVFSVKIPIKQGEVKTDAGN
jgi:signal transduction histidine kinase